MSPGQKENRFWTYVVTFNQVLILPFLYIALKLIFRGNINNKLTLIKSPNTHFVIASNHQSILDPFMIAASIPPKIITKLLPLRFMADNIYLNKWPIGFFMRLLGSFPAFKSQDEISGLERAELLFKKNHTVVIFPEGQRTPHEKPAKKGIEILAKYQNTYIIPVKILWTTKTFIRKVEIIIDNPIKLDEQNAQQILNKIYSIKS